MTKISKSVLNILNHHLKIGEKTLIGMHIRYIYQHIKRKICNILANLSNTLIIENYA